MRKQRKLRKLLAMMLAIAMLACIFSACAKSEPAAATQPAAEPSADQAPAQEAAAEPAAQPPAEESPAAPEPAAEAAQPEPEAAPAPEAPAPEAPAPETPAPAEPGPEGPGPGGPPPGEPAGPGEPGQPEPPEEPEDTTIFTGTAILAPKNDMVLPLVEDVVTYDLFFSFPPPLADRIEELMYGPALEELTNRTNVSIEFYAVSAAVASEKYPLMLATGDFPAILQDLEGNYSGGLDQAIEQEIILDCKPLIEEYIPIYAQVLSESEEIRLALTTTEGHIPGITRLYKEPSKSKLGEIVRKDWLDDLGLEVPGTMDEMTAVLTAFRDEKGAAEPFYLPASGLGSNDCIVGAYGISSGYYQEDGTVKLGFVEPGFQDYLAQMHDWYTQNLVSADYINNTANYPDNGDVTNGSVGVFLQEDGFLEDVYSYMVNPDDTLELAAVPGMVLREGEVNHFGGGYGDWTGGTTWNISTNCSDPEPLCRMLNYLFTEEGSLLANYGVEGISLAFDEDGKPYATDTIFKNPEMGSMEAQLKYTLPFSPFVEDYDRFNAGYTQRQLDAPGIWATNMDKQNVLPSGLSISSVYSDEYTSIYNDISTYINESISKFITGARPLSEYDAYVDEIKGMNVDRCIEIWQILLDEYMNK